MLMWDKVHDVSTNIVVELVVLCMKWSMIWYDLGTGETLMKF
jgi:hypothetical protein